MAMQTHRRTSAVLGALAITLVGGPLMGYAMAGPRPEPSAKASARGSAVEETLTIPTDQLHHAPEVTEADAAPEEDAAPAPAAPTGTIGAYRIGPGDVLDFRLFNQETLNSLVEVRYDGCVSLPIIPDVRVSGLTRAEATERIREAYTVEFRDPSVSVSVHESRSKVFYLMGDVNQPSEYAYTRPLTLLDAINTGGGLRINLRGGDSFVGAQGQLTKAVIIRHVEERREVLTYDLSNLQEPGSHPSDAPVYPGDVVYIPEAVNLVYMLGEVRRPDVFQLNEGMTLVQLLARAGGVVESTGGMRRVVLMREMDDATTRIELINLRTILKRGNDPVLRAGDIIYVPQRRLSRLGQFVQQFTATISPILSLYRDAYDTYYTADRLERLLTDESLDTGNLLAADQLLNKANALTLR